MTWTRNTTVTVSVLALALVTAVAVKLVFFPSVKDTYFVLNNQNLQQVPAGLLVVRPTHFPNSGRKGISYASTMHDGKNVQRIVGRCVSLSNLVAVAYHQNPSRVALPIDAPKGNFDFLVSVSDQPDEHLQTAIRRKLGYVAQMETRDTEVLALKVVNGDLPGITVSSEDEKRNVNFQNGKLYFTHMRLTAITDGLEQMLKTPVVDNTDLTNFYDYSVTWDAQTQRKMRNAAMARDTVDAILRNWGLALEPDNQPIKVLVVKRAP